MAKPDYAFKTSTHTFYAAEASSPPQDPAAAAASGSDRTIPAGGGRTTEYVSEPGGHRLRFSLQAQHIPPELCSMHSEPRSSETERAAMAWLIARGGRELNLNGQRKAIAPADLDRPPSGPVERLVSIAPSNAEIVGALEATGLLVGVESSSDFPPEVNSLPRLGPDLHVDMGALAALEPQLVLASLSVPGMERNITALEQLGVPYLVLAPRNLAEIFQEIHRVGAALGREARAGQVVASMQERIARLRRAQARERPVRVYLEWWPKPMFSPGQACWSNELIEAAGGVNVFRHLEGQSREVSPAEVAAADPEVIFVSWCGVPMHKLNPKRVLEREGLAGVSAIRHGRVHAMDESLLGRPGPRVVEGIAQLAEKLAEVS